LPPAPSFLRLYVMLCQLPFVAWDGGFHGGVV